MGVTRERDGTVTTGELLILGIILLRQEGCSHPREGRTAGLSPSPAPEAHERICRTHEAISSLSFTEGWLFFSPAWNSVSCSFHAQSA